ncbi:hypothetical protein MJO28_016302 [Puccinia striiformis f. sp. tritici]|uniref:Peroxin-3 n=2 Tax=Puccinia striiformis TaxID=27350 RepID=A0A2S4VCF2_9BASI|nr:hypothetical protein Pst134EB_031110 [Puccinia striiformis f. sp. tritici]KAI7935057.1 hypothetical protein MJO29_016320 [Puccinia striiformis f. sp. tritici]KAI7935431.1 hypothetical protein MJO28_016302 [Puccinia striiformis f. sp. tritici]KAI9601930.1 hypothetical protein KEM48_001218 [Puccinia striiformis f. sp. tritici PST-130]POW07145.1 hypothetical protein PSHT_10057 [Puccinia striiformis]
MDYLAGFLKRSRRPITMVASVLGGGYLAVSYLRSKLDEMQDSLTRTRACTENLRRRFEQNQEDCSFTVLALIPTLGKQVVQAMNVEKLVEVLSQTKSRPATKPAPSTADDNHQPSSSNQENITEKAEKINGDSRIIDNESMTDVQHNHSLDNSITSSSDITNNIPLDNHNPTLNPVERSQEPSTSKLLPPQDVADLLVRPDGTIIQKRSEIWREMMIISFTRLFTCLYGVTLLTLQTHIQLGLLGRDSYLSSILSTSKAGLLMDDDEEDSDDEDRTDFPGSQLDPSYLIDSLVERKYLTFSYWYLHHGWVILAARTRSAVVNVLATRSLKDTLSESDLLHIFLLIRKNVELESDGLTEYNFGPIILPTNPDDELKTLQEGGMGIKEDFQVSGRLRTLLDETQDYIDCPDFRRVLSESMNRIMDLCLSNILRNASMNPSLLPSPNLTIHPSSSYASSSIDIPPLTRFSDINPGPPNPRIVDIIPIISKESLEILNVIPNQYIDTIGETPELKEFSSIIYTTFDSFTNSDS